MKSKPDSEAVYNGTLRLPMPDAVLLKELAYVHRRSLNQEVIVVVQEYIERHRKDLKGNGAEALRAAGLPKVKTP
jgi:hypothetical protein